MDEILNNIVITESEVKEFINEFSEILKNMDIIAQGEYYFKRRIETEFRKENKPYGVCISESTKYACATRDQCGEDCCDDEFSDEEKVIYISFWNDSYDNPFFLSSAKTVMYGNNIVDGEFLKNMDAQTQEELLNYFTATENFVNMIVDKINDWYQTATWEHKQMFSPKTKLKLQQIKDISRKGYIDDPDMIEKAIHSFLDMPLSELTNDMEESYRYEFPEFLSVYYDFTVSSLKNISVADVICLAESIKDVESFIYDNPNGMEKMEYQKLLYHCITTTITFNQGINDKVKLLFSIKYDSLIDFFKHKRIDTDIENYLSEITGCEEDIINNATWEQKEIIKENSTLGSIVNELASIKKRPWAVYSNGDDFQKTVLTADRMQTIVLFDMMYEVFIEKMRYKDLRKRLYKIAFDEIDWNNADIYDLRFVEGMEI